MRIVMEKEFECCVTEECEGCGVSFVPSGETLCEDCLKKEDPWERETLAEDVDNYLESVRKFEEQSTTSL